MESNIFTSRSLLTRFLFIVISFYLFLVTATYFFLRSIEPELINNKKNEHAKLISNIELNMELQNIPYEKDNLRRFLIRYKSLLPNINQIRIYNLNKDIIIDTHSLDLNNNPFFTVPPVREKKIDETDDETLESSSLKNSKQEQVIGGLTRKYLEEASFKHVTTYTRKINGNFTVFTLAGLSFNNKEKGYIVISEEANDIEIAVQERRYFVIRTAISVAIIILIFSLYLSFNILRPIRALGRFTSSASEDNPDTKMINKINLRADEIGNLSRSLSAMTDNLYKRIEFAERFASDLTHEIRNPLTSLKAASELLLTTNDLEKKSKLMDILNHDVFRIERLISDYSQMLKDEASETKLQLIKFDIVELLTIAKDELLKMYANTNKNIKININNPNKNKTFVLGFQNRMKQVFSNIIENSISFTPDNGTIEIKVEKLKKIVKIVFIDEGPGFNENDINKIFDRFYSNRPKEMFGQHSGLGLNIVKNIVDAHKGKIKAYNLRNSKKKGAVIEIDLPIAE